MAYAAHGWPVFALGPSKKPLATCVNCSGHRGDVVQMEACGCLTCHSFYAATTRPERIEAMVARSPRGCLAIRTGSASGLVVVDVDPRSGGQQTLAQLDASSLLPGTVMTVTGSGGIHLYYRHPGFHVPSRAGAFGPGVDCKADGGYVIVPPSRHPAAVTRYRWSGGVWQHDLPPLPAGLASMASKGARRHPPATRGMPRRTSSDSGRRRLDGVVRVALRAPVGQRNNRLYWAGVAAAELEAEGVVPRGLGERAVQQAGQAVGLDGREVRATVRSAFGRAQ